ncbi:MAG: TolC family protein, partial [Terriglobales bacterium]
MSLPWLNSLNRLTAAVLLAGVFSIGGVAQDAVQTPPPAPQASQPAAAQGFVVRDYSKPESHFPNPIAPYKPRSIAPPDLSNTPRITDLMRDGKIMLSIDDAVALALENNLDIAIARYNLNIADTDVLRAKSGAGILGVNAGVVQGTPGGGGGGLG